MYHLKSKVFQTRLGRLSKKEFGNFLKCFVATIRSCLERPCLLIVDNHEIYAGLSVLMLALENGVHVVTLPLYCSTKLQFLGSPSTIKDSVQLSRTLLLLTVRSMMLEWAKRNTYEALQ